MNLGVLPCVPPAGPSLNGDNGSASGTRGSTLRFRVRAFRRFALFVLLGLVIFPGLLPAQTNAPVKYPDRYLFIVDTSAAMRRRAPAVQKAVENLLRSSMAAQLQRGDSVGMWTFNEQLYAGRLPLQIWTPETSDLITSNVVGFLKAQTYTGESRFEAVAPVLRRIVGESPRLTILLVSDGNEEISGTPFDTEIRRALASKSREQQKARMPFVTVFRSARGRIASATVNLAPWPVEFPKFPPEPVVVEAPKPETKPKPEGPRPTVPNLIVIGNRKQAPEADTNAVPAAATNSPTPSAATPVVPEGQLPAAVTSDTPVQTNAPAATDPTTPTTAAPTATESPTAIIPVQPVPDVVSDKPALTPITIAAVAPPRAEPAPPVTTTPEPTAVETPATVAPAIPEETAPSFVATNQPTEVAVAMASDSGTVPWGLIAAGTVPIVLGVAVFVFLQRRARSSGHGSLITRSLDREKK